LVTVSNAFVQAGAARVATTGAAYAAVVDAPLETSPDRAIAAAASAAARACLSSLGRRERRPTECLARRRRETWRSHGD